MNANKKLVSKYYARLAQDAIDQRKVEELKAEQHRNMLAGIYEENVELFDTYDVPYSSSILKGINKQRYEAKLPLIKILRNHPMWNEEKQMVILPERTILRGFDRKGITEFFDWARRAVVDVYINDSYTKRSEMKQILSVVHGIILRDLELGRSTIDTSAIHWVCDDVPPFANGMKWSRWINKLLKMWKLNTVVDIKTEIYTSQDGVVHERQRDYGYNYYFALLGDSINPLEIPHKTFCLSVNDIDFYTMSFGHDWASCHTIDKGNRRGCDKTYEGQYSSGTMSYMLDRTTMIAYYVDEQNEPRSGRNGYHKYGKDVPYELRDKEHRCVFSWENDKLYQGRVYPDGRDGGEEGIASQMREIVQQIFAECLKVSNIWKTEHGTIEYPMIRSEGTHYRDYECCSDSVLSFLRRINGKLNEEPIHIGHNPICPNCGEEHERTEHVCCEDCWGDNDIICDRCGCSVDEDDAIAVGGNWYCCERCANGDGWYICEDDDEWHSEDELYYCDDDNAYHLEDYCQRCDGDGSYYHYVLDGVETEDGHWFHDEDTAIEEGYIYDAEANEWIKDEEEEED